MTAFVIHLVCEVHADLLQHVRWNLSGEKKMFNIKTYIIFLKSKVIRPADANNSACVEREGKKLVRVRK